MWSESEKQAVAAADLDCVTPSRGKHKRWRLSDSPFCWEMKGGAEFALKRARTMGLCKSHIRIDADGRTGALSAVKKEEKPRWGYVSRFPSTLTRREVMYERQSTCVQTEWKHTHTKWKQKNARETVRKKKEIREKTRDDDITNQSHVCGKRNSVARKKTCPL